MNSQSNFGRVLGIAPSSRGIGYAVIDENQKLMDWGVKNVKGDKNAHGLKKIEELIAQYQPTALAIEDSSVKGSRRALRIKALHRQIAALAKAQKVKVRRYSRQQVMEAFFIDGQGTKHDLAEILSRRFTDELGNRLPPKRRPWMSEDYRMGMFDAVALALLLSTRKESAPPVDS